MTHQDIVDRMEALGVEHSKAYQLERARIRKEQDSLRELCGGIGHVFGNSAALGAYARGRCCVFCSAAEPAKD